MGSSHVKDKNIDLFVESNKQYYVAGEYVEGCAYLNAKATSNYRHISITVLGQQYVYWSEGSGKNRRTYSHRYESYRSSFLMNDFGGTVNAGHYSFPFAFRLPNMMCGSFFQSNQCYIKYFIKVQLVHPTKEDHTQFFDMPLNIMQPPRSPLGQLAISTTTNARCCGCCADYGTTVVSMNCDKNFVLNGDPIYVKGKVDHSQGKEDINIARVMLYQMLIKVSSGGHSRSRVMNSWGMHGINQPIKKGQTRQFQFTGNIPPQITNYTAIGRVAAVYFLLAFESEYGCCANTASAKLHLIVHSRTPQIIRKMQLPQPSSWNPIVSPLVVCENMKPYTLNPMPQIPFHNMPGVGNVIQPPIYEGNQMNNGYPPMDPNYGNQNNYSNDGFNNQQAQPYFQNIDQYAHYTPTYSNYDPYAPQQGQTNGYADDNIVKK